MLGFALEMLILSTLQTLSDQNFNAELQGVTEEEQGLIALL